MLIGAAIIGITAALHLLNWEVCLFALILANAGRAKRFAKIAGEMISLTMVESYIQAIWPNHNHAVLNVPHQKKAEELVLFTNY